MYGDDHKLLEKLIELTEENNKILHQARRARRLAGLFTFMKWVVIIALSYGSYVYVQPYLDTIFKFYQEVLPGMSEANKNFDLLESLESSMN